MKDEYLAFLYLLPHIIVFKLLLSAFTVMTCSYYLQLIYPLCIASLHLFFELISDMYFCLVFFYILIINLSHIFTRNRNLFLKSSNISDNISVSVIYFLSYNYGETSTPSIWFLLFGFAAVWLRAAPSPSLWRFPKTLICSWISCLISGCILLIRQGPFFSDIKNWL